MIDQELTEEQIMNRLLDESLEFDMPDLFDMSYSNLKDKNKVLSALDQVKNYGNQYLVDLIHDWINHNGWN